MTIFNPIKRFFGMILGFFYNITGNYILALALFALVIQILLIPFAIKQQKNSIKQARLAPKLMAIRRKYAGREDRVTKQKMQQETMELYQHEGFNPAGGCLPLLIQMPIILLLYRVVTEPLQWVVGLSTDAVNTIKELLGKADVASEIKIASAMQTELAKNSAAFDSVAEWSGKTLPNFKIGSFDLGDIPSELVHDDSGWHWSWLILIPLVTLGMMLLTQWITRKLTYQAPDAAEQQKSPAMRIMNLAMPLLSAYIAYIWPAAIGIYWFIRNVYQVAQQYIISKVMPLPKFTEEDYKAAERELRGKAPQKKIEKNPDAGSKKSLFHMDDDDYVPPQEDADKGGSSDGSANSAIEAAPLKDDKPDKQSKLNGKDADEE